MAKRLVLLLLLGGALIVLVGGTAAAASSNRGETLQPTKHAQLYADQNQKDGEHGRKGDDNDDNGDNDDNDNEGHGHKGTANGPFTVVVTDNGSCGNAWATDTIKRTYTVWPNGDGTFTIRETDRGNFVTIGGPSPGACDEAASRPPRSPEPGSHGTVVSAGVKGQMKGFIQGTVSCAGPCVYNASAAANCGGAATTGCYRDVFLLAAFGPTARWSCLEGTDPCSFNFDYRAHDQGLKYHHWIDRGTATTEQFYGDIANA